LPVPPAYSSLDLERNTSRNPAIPAFKEGCKLIGMKALTDLIVVQKILGCPIEEVQHDPVGIKPLAISIKDDDELGHSIHELLQIPLRLLAILYVRPCQVPANDYSMFIAQGVAADQEPAMLSVFSAEPGFGFPHLSFFNPGIAQPAVVLNISRMK